MWTITKASSSASTQFFPLISWPSTSSRSSVEVIRSHVKCELSKKPRASSMYNLSRAAARSKSTISVDRYSPKCEEMKNGSDFDQTNPLRLHEMKHHISWIECIFQLFASIPGPAFFVLPSAFRGVGYLFGIIGSLATGVFYLYMIHVLLWCEKQIRMRTSIPEEKKMSLYTLIGYVFSAPVSPITVKLKKSRLSYYLREVLRYEIIVNWLCSLAFCQAFIGRNLRVILRYYGYEISRNIILLAQFSVNTVITWIPGVGGCSFIAYFSTFVVLIVMFEILFFMAAETNLNEPTAYVMVGSMTGFINFFSDLFLTIYCTPVVFPLKNDMKNTNHFGSTFGSLNVTVLLLLLLSSTFAIVCYLGYGEHMKSNAIESLSTNDVTIISSCVLIFFMFSSNVISFFVVFESIWTDQLKSRFVGSRFFRIYEYIFRFGLNVFVSSLALSLHSFNTFINLISCFSFSFDSIFLPIAMETVVVWRYKECNFYFAYTMVKNSIIIVLCIGFSTLSLWSFVDDIYEYYVKTGKSFL